MYRVCVRPTYAMEGWGWEDTSFTDTGLLAQIYGKSHARGSAAADRAVGESERLATSSD
jgi:hypothetical protein